MTEITPDDGPMYDRMVRQWKNAAESERVVDGKTVRDVGDDRGGNRKAVYQDGENFKYL